MKFCKLEQYILATRSNKKFKSLLSNYYYSKVVEQNRKLSGH